ncbi:ribonuclease Z [Salinarchaeum sp. Harcht-Bsk1]|uniref:ribonuclease Z n=1 Tax=Salinarchaeum sp. Harcht-Bsk1 TaxID=1333523 RepID=UPI00034243F1|nr:ribonuclease Z [Salinarchaeum sp. Harcht-Bsk1]AGN01875.1 ribonuclease Z [Salinarchaeum sp. Harcht-Bsk1]
MTLRVTFLGTGGAVPTTERNPSALLVNREGDRLLFDCGEGTQRQLMRFGAGFDVSHLFVTHLHGDHVYGIPGFLETLDFNDREDPLTIHVPPGTKGKVRSFLESLGGWPSFPLRLSETSPGAVPLRREDYEVRAFDVDHRTNAVGYVLEEDDRKGRFDRQRAEELGVPVGPKFSTLHEGESVELDDGTTIEPEQVVGEPRPGRTLVYTGDTRPQERTVEVARNADLLIHDATFADDRAERARKTAHSTAREAGEIAQRADVRRLALTHVSSRYAHDVSAHETEANEAFDGEAFVPHDGDVVEVPFPDGGSSG